MMQDDLELEVTLRPRMHHRALLSRRRFLFSRFPLFHADFPSAALPETSRSRVKQVFFTIDAPFDE